MSSSAPTAASACANAASSTATTASSTAATSTLSTTEEKKLYVVLFRIEGRMEEIKIFQDLTSVMKYVVKDIARDLTDIAKLSLTELEKKYYEAYNEYNNDRYNLTIYRSPIQPSL